MANENYNGKVERHHYLDALRGVTIFLVVYCHVGTWIEQYSDLTVSLLQLVRMPLFYFISGFMAWGVYDWALTRRRLKRRLLQQFYPTVLIMIIYALFLGVSVEEIMFHNLKMGYWFTISLFFSFLIFIVTCRILNSLKAKNSTVLITFVSVILIDWIATVVIKYNYEWIYAAKISSLFTLSKVMGLTPFFFLGAIVSMYREKLEKLFYKWWLIYAAAILFFMGFFFIDTLYSTLFSIAGIFLLYGFFYKTRNYWACESALPVCLRYVGTRTLPIYLFQYFFLEFMAACARHFDFHFEWNAVINASIMFVTAIIIVAMTLITDNLLKKIPFLYFILFQKKERMAI